MGTCQSILCTFSAFLYILFRRNSGESLASAVGLEPSKAYLAKQKTSEKPAKAHANGTSAPSSWSRRSLLIRYLQTSALITSAAPFGFAALSYISYPAMVLGKSCKLVPVMIMNVLLYRRRFAPHKYLVVFMVTTGITVFMGVGDKKSSHTPKKANVSEVHPYANLIGITYLLINLAIDGAVNSTQDEIFVRYQVTGQQMMLWINIFCTAISTVLSILPLPFIPVIHPSPSGTTELATAYNFIRTHPSIIRPLAEFAITGALGQLFIFETLQHFGSLALV